MERSDVIADTSVGGLEACRALSDATDRMLRGIFDDAVAGEKKADRIALLAVGGYGRRELAPFSDLDVLLVHDGVKNIADVASRIWYPIWDAGLKLGHAVRTPKETLSLCTTDLDTATSLVTARFLAGNESLASEVIAGAADSWRRAMDRRRAGSLVPPLGRMTPLRPTGEDAYRSRTDCRRGERTRAPEASMVM